MVQFRKFAPYFVVLVMLLVAAGYAIGKKQALLDNTRDADTPAAAQG